MISFKKVILLLFLTWRYQAESAYAETFKKCCDLGNKWADEELNCAEFHSPIAGITNEEQNMCLSSVKLCCQKNHKESQCNAGQIAAKNDVSCTPSASKPGSENFKDCCENCKIGIMIGKGGGLCDPTSIGLPMDQSFLACCNELVTTESTPVMSSTTTITSTSTTVEDVTPDNDEKEITATTPRTTLANPRTRNKILPPPPPPLDSLCDTLADELCAHTCISIPGSYKCECRRGFTLMDDGKSCQQKDVSDRCKINNPCEQQCIDTGFAVRCSCDGGYKLNPDKITCRDIDECEEGLHKCEENLMCINELGTYDCVDSDDNLSEPKSMDKCPLGFKYDSYSNSCSDLDECMLALDTCPPEKSCENTMGSYTCIDGVKNKPLDCPKGYHYKPSIESCTDIDECATGQDNCNRDSQICINMQGGFTCQNKASKNTCPAGFKINLIGICEDIDECQESLEVCNTNEKCFNELGGYRCMRPENDQNDFTSTQTSPTPTNITNPQQPTTSVTTPKNIPYPNNPFIGERTSKPQSAYVPQTPQIASCQSGFVYSSPAQRCIDVDECQEDNHACDSNQECRNTIGSFRCICKIGFQLDTVTGACVDVNECQTNVHNCVQSQRCDNTIGSYQCVRYTSCGTGYTLNAASGLCEDDDECVLETHDCRVLGPNFQCRNTLGSFRCERKRCLSASNCFEQRTVFTIPRAVFIPVTAIDVPASRTPLTTIQLKQCLPGYFKNKEGYCDDINECDKSPCAKHQKCININGSFRCVNLINCPPGFKIDDQGAQCEDIDECETGTHSCSNQQQCINREGYHICQCPPGHKTSKENQCEDINECDYFRGQMICGRSAECINTVGSYKCQCKEGFKEGKNERSCDDIDECKDMPGLCEHTCVNVWGSYRCACKPGFILNADNRTCSDNDECEMFKDKHLCIGECENVPGSYTCRCPDGYRLGTDGRTCQDIDECERGNICPRSDDVCLNIRGSYRCNSIQCPTNYIRDPAQRNRCKRTTQYCNSADLECIRQPSTYSHNFITFVSRLPLPVDGQLDLFTMRGPQWDTTTTFNMEMLNVRCPAGVPKADKSYFKMRRGNVNEVILSLVNIIEGPQEAELQLTMEVYQNGEYKGSVVAKVFIIVSQYEF